MILKLIKNIYKSKGFNNVSVSSCKLKNFLKIKVNLIFEINEGNQLKLNKINFLVIKFFF